MSDYIPGPEVAMTLAPAASDAAYNPPGNRVVFQPVRVPGTIGTPNRTFMSAPIPIPGTIGSFTQTVLLVPGGWNIR